MNSTVQNFYSKNVANYISSYRLDHSPRLRAVLERHTLIERMKGKRMLDIGGGLGFLGEFLSLETEYWVVDGADIKPEERLCDGFWVKADLDYDFFSAGQLADYEHKFDACFCQEVLEHLSNPYHCLSEIKKLVRFDADIFISVPTEKVLHNVVYPALLWPYRNFEQFLGQMALEIVDQWEYTPENRGWPAYQWRCRNLPWDRKVLPFIKSETKFLDCTPLEATNL